MPKHDRRSSDITPSPYRLLQSLRDVGYDFVTALADIVDNAITAGAKQVAIEVNDKSWPPTVVVADNGTGMTHSRLVEALRLGAVRDYESDDLGKFGLGLKTASLSQCRRLTVVTRHSACQYRLAAATLDLDDVAISNSWTLDVNMRPDTRDLAGKWLAGSTGTVVIWQKLDRVVSAGDSATGWDRRRLQRMVDAASAHLAMVFHRFIEGTEGACRLRLIINGRRISAWNPYAPEEEHSQALSEHRFELDTSGSTGDVVVRGHVLPTRDQFSTPEAFENLSGPKKWNRQQGFYIYRNGRLIQSGGWCGMRAADEHTKLARISLDFPSSLDDLFHVNIAKMRASIPAELRTLLERVVLDTVKAGQAAYRGPLKVVSPDDDTTDQIEKRPSSPRGTNSPPYGELMLALRAAAMAAGEGKSLSRILDRFRLDAPELAALAGFVDKQSPSSKKRALRPNLR